jgi:hypothetical protein
MIRCVRLWTGDDRNSHFEEGVIDLEPGQRGDVLSSRMATKSISFEETASGGAFAWHTAPITQLVITLSGTLDFQTREGEHFLIRPGDILFAEDNRHLPTNCLRLIGSVPALCASQEEGVSPALPPVRSVAEFWVPTGSTPPRGKIENIPQRRDIWRSMGVLPGILGAAALAGPEMMNLFPTPDPNVQRRPLAAIGSQPSVCFGEVVPDALVKPKVAPSTFPGKFKLAGDRRSADDRQCDALLDILGGDVERAQ